MRSNNPDLTIHGEKPASAPPLSPAMPAASAPAAVSFQRPEPDVLNKAIPVVFIGRNREGFWVVRDAEAKFGGLFWRKRAALDFAKTHGVSVGCAIVFPQARFELDMENQGNPLIGVFMTARRLTRRSARKLLAY